jgi:predicted permease
MNRRRLQIRPGCKRHAQKAKIKCTFLQHRALISRKDIAQRKFDRQIQRPVLIEVASLIMLLLTFAVPVAAFVGIAQTSRTGLEENGKLGFVLIISMLVIFGITFALNHYIFRLSPGENAVQSLSVGFPNFPAVGLPLVSSLMGPSSAVSVAVALVAGSIFVSPLTLGRFGSARKGDQLFT